MELVLAALCTRSSALARGELAHESTGGGFPSCVFVFPNLVGKLRRLKNPAKAGQQRGRFSPVRKHRPQNSTKRVKKNDVE